MADSTIRTTDRRRRRLLASLGALGAGTLLAGCDWTKSQGVQDFLGRTEDLTQAAMRLVSSREALAREYPPSAVAETFRPNGSIRPQSAVYQALVDNGFADYKLAIRG